MALHDIRISILQDYAIGNDICWGIEVYRYFPTGRSTTDYLVPNTLRAWHEYVEGQPEFCGLPALGTPRLGNIEWAKAKLRTGEIHITNKILYINAFDLLHSPTMETTRARKALILNQ
ncbi:hypothetical protein GOP47_0017013 [Adiantum capillus-veneris]|uniref:Uncharacterized protein n=1 Tax=Adiantum capillus-veneris TaxID=13818 RepID=A0A9D4UIR8_ADICA|nr:hypothetical protein GOP47_0017013 [Adiantum capillus-veneris]